MFLRRIRENSKIIAIVLALCLALTAQYLFTGEIFTHQLNSNNWVWTPNNGPALIMLLLAIGFATWAAMGGEMVAVEAADAIHFWGDKPKLRRLWLICSGVSYVLSLIVYALAGENNLVRWLWAAGIGLMIIPLWMQRRGNPPENRIPSWEWILVGIIALIGFGLRYWKLTEIPSQVDNDVAVMGTYALQLIKSGNYNLIGYSGSEHLLSYDQFLAWGMRLFGNTHYGIVIHSVVFGTLSLIFVFMLGRELAGRFVGFVAMGLLTISYTHIHFSRILFGSSVSAIAIFVFYSLYKGLRTREYFWFALCGVLVGGELLLYDSGRVIPVAIVVVFIWQWIWQRPSFRFKNWIILFAGMVIAYGPVLVFAVRDFYNFSGRANVVLLWNPMAWQHAMYTYNATSPFQVLWQQTWRTFLTLHLTGDGSSHFAFPRPMVSPLAALLFTLGLGYTFARIRNIIFFAVLSWFMLTFILGGVLTSDPPYWPHLNIALPAIVLVAAMGAKSLADKTLEVYGQVGYKVYAWVMVSLIVITGINNWQIYYDYVRDNAGNRIRISRYINTLPLSFKVYLFSPNFTWEEYAFRFFNQGRIGQSLLPEDLEAKPPVIDQPTVFILFQYPDVLPLLQNLYPGGEVEKHFNFDSQVSFLSYSVIPPGYEITPNNDASNPLSLPGWILIFGMITYGVGYVAYVHYSSLEDDARTRENGV